MSVGLALKYLLLPCIENLYFVCVAVGIAISEIFEYDSVHIMKGLKLRYYRFSIS